MRRRAWVGLAGLLGLAATVAVSAPSRGAGAALLPEEAVSRGRLRCGRVEQSTLREPGEVHAWSVVADRGELLNIAVTTLDSDDGLRASWALYAPDGRVIRDNRATDSLAAFDEPGSYTVLIQDTQGGATGRYALQLQWLAGAGSCAVPIDLDRDTTGTISHGVEHVVYRFTGESRDRLRARVDIASESEGFEPVWTILGPNGAVVGGVRNTQGGVMLPLDGLYTVLIEDRALEGTGNFTFHLHVADRDHRPESHGEGARRMIGSSPPTDE